MMMNIMRDDDDHNYDHDDDDDHDDNYDEDHDDNNEDDHLISNLKIANGKVGRRLMMIIMKMSIMSMMFMITMMKMTTIMIMIITSLGIVKLSRVRWGGGIAGFLCRVFYDFLLPLSHHHH